MVDYYEARAPEYDDWYLRRGRYARGADPRRGMERRARCGRSLAGRAAVERRDRRAGRRDRLVVAAPGVPWRAVALRRLGRRARPCPRAAGRPRAAGASARPRRVGRARPPGRRRVHGFLAEPRAARSARRTSWPSAGAGCDRAAGSPFIDSLADPASGAADHPEPADDRAVRRLDDGREFTIVKVFYAPDELSAALAGSGLRRGRRHDDWPVLRPGLGSGCLTVRACRERRGPVAILRPMSPLSNATIATVGSGVMAEAMIAGLLRDGLVTPDRVVASHPRAERREILERAYGIRTVAGNADAVARRRRHPARDQAADARTGRPRHRTAPAPRPARPERAGRRDHRGADRDPRARPGRAQHAQHAGPARQGRDGLVRDARDDRRAARAGGRTPRRPRASSSRSTTRRWSRWRPRSAAPARPTCSWSWRR